MRITLMHHHLHPGGVTSVIGSQVKALKHKYPDLDIRLFVGHTNDAPVWDEYGVEVLVFPELNYLYDHEGLSYDKVTLQAERLAEMLDEYLTEDDILHVHNLNLGKNPALTYAVWQKAQKGLCVLNHSHDFAEDRPQNQAYLQKGLSHFLGEKPRKVMYPELPNYHFGVLNTYDYKRLVTYGVPEARIELFPNPVAIKTNLPGKAESREAIVNSLSLDPAKKIVTYPVRVIQRKNIGEFILLSILLGDTAEWLVTQPPKNPEEIKHYGQWLDFCQAQGIRLHFEAGTKVDFLQLMVASDFCATTSYREGFGLAFLEPWLFDSPIVGRDLPEITRDMKDNGLLLPTAYTRLEVEFHQKKTDFKELSEAQQREFLEGLIKSKTLRRQVLVANPTLGKLLKEVPGSIIKHNQSVIRNEYAYDKYAEKLHAGYQKLFTQTG